MKMFAGLMFAVGDNAPLGVAASNASAYLDSQLHQFVMPMGPPRQALLKVLSFQILQSQ